MNGTTETAGNNGKAAYPRRPAYYANRYCRLLTKTCAAQELGPDGCWLLTVIALLEDSKRYTDAITFYNQQLMSIAGFTREHTLIAVRDRAVTSGWLHYEPGGKRKPGRYWVIIPARFAVIPDGPCDEEHGVPELFSTDEIVSESVGKASAKEQGNRQSKRRESDSPSYLTQDNPPPPPSPAGGGGGSEGDWQTVELNLLELGISDARGACDGARERGMSPKEVTAIIDEWNGNRPAWDVGAIHWRLTRGTWPRPKTISADEEISRQEKERTRRLLDRLGDRKPIPDDEPSLIEQLTNLRTLREATT